MKDLRRFLLASALACLVLALTHASVVRPIVTAIKASTCTVIVLGGEQNKEKPKSNLKRPKYQGQEYKL